MQFLQDFPQAKEPAKKLMSEGLCVGPPRSRAHSARGSLGFDLVYQWRCRKSSSEVNSISMTEKVVLVRRGEARVCNSVEDQRWWPHCPQGTVFPLAVQGKSPTSFHVYAGSVLLLPLTLPGSWPQASCFCNIGNITWRASGKKCSKSPLLPLQKMLWLKA